MTLTLRNATHADAELIAGYEDEFFPGLAFDECRIALTDDVEFMNVHEYLDDPETRIVLASIDGQNAGYVVGWLHDGLIETLSIGVREAFRRRGLAAQLLRTMEDWGRENGARISELESHALQPAPSKFYPSQGYKHVRTEPGYYKDGGDGWIWQKDITVTQKLASGGLKS